METLKSLLDDLRSLQEDATNTLDNSYSAARKIWESLPENERLLVSPRGNYVDSPNLIKRVVINGKGFADAYKYNGKDDIAFTVVAISPNCRGQGLSKQLITRLENELKRKGVKKIIHRAERTNNASIGLAKSLGYHFDGETKHQVRFSKVLNESFKMGFDYSENLYELEKHCKTPEEFNKFLNKNFDYGYIKDGNIVKPGKNDNFKDYRTISLRDFLCYRVGVCWDYAEFEAWFFEKYLGYKMNYKSPLKDKEFSLYYIQIDNNKNCPSHTWLAYKDGSKVKSFESSWLSHQGIKTFDSEKKMLEYYMNAHEKSYNLKNYPMYAYKYKPIGKYGLDAIKFMDTIYDNGVVLRYDSNPNKVQLVLNEGILFSDDDYKHNVEDFMSGKEKILYVFGLSGSGKTTMTNKLAKLLNCKVIHIDEVHHEMSKKFGKNWKNGSLSQQQRRDIVWNEVKKRAGDDKCIIEGGAMIVYKVEDLEKKPYIIPGTSVITSTFRMLKRTLSNDPKQGLPAFFKDYEGKSKFDMLKNMIRIIYNCAKGNIDMAGKFDAYKKIL